MDESSMETFLTGKSPQSAPPAAPAAQPTAGKAIVPEVLKTALLIALAGAVTYLIYDSYRFQQKTAVDMASLTDQLKVLENRDRASEAKLSTMISETQASVGSTKQELLRKTAAQAAQLEANATKTKTELNQAIATKADSSHVQAIKQEADAKIGQVSTEVGGVKSDVGTVKTDLASTKRDLEGTQRQLVDVKDTLTAAVAKNAGELSELRRKGERDFFEFEIPKKNVITKVEDIRLVLTSTDPKKNKYSMQVLVDDSRLEKRDRTANEPVQFLVGRNRLRYEVVINWVQKDKIGGYLSIPKDKALAAERAQQTK